MTNKDSTRTWSRRRLLAAAGGCLLTGSAGCSANGSQDGATSSPPVTTTGQSDGVYRTGLGPDTFEELSDIDVESGQVAADTQRQVTGTQCAALETGADGAWLHLSFDEPLDFSVARPACHIAADGTAAGDTLYLDLEDRDGNRFRTRTKLRSHETLFRVDFGVYEPQVDDAPVDLSNIVRLSFRPDARDGAGTETVYLDFPERVVAPETPKVLFQFDDGNVTDYTEGLEYLSQYGYPATAYVNTGRVGNDGRMDIAQLDQLQDAGWIIGSHTPHHTDLTSLSDPSEVERRVREGKQWLLDHGFTQGARHFAYPYNQVDEQVHDIVSRHHDTGRVWDWQPVALPSNPHFIPGEGDPTPETVRTLLDHAVQYGGVVTVFYHFLGHEQRREHFQAVVDEVHRRERAGEVDVIGVDDLESLAMDAR